MVWDPASGWTEPLPSGLTVRVIYSQTVGTLEADVWCPRCDGLRHVTFETGKPPRWECGHDGTAEAKP